MSSQKFFKFENLKKYSNNKLILFRENEENDLILLYGDIIRVSKAFCKSLTKYGVDSQKVLTIKAETSPALCALILCALNRGNPFCLISAQANEKNVKKSLTGYNANLFITCTPFSSHCGKLLEQVQIFKDVFYIYKMNDSMPNVPAEYCFSVQTSGSTGVPKVVHVQFECIGANITSLSNLFSITESDVILWATPITFDPFVVELFLALRNGAALLVTTRSILLSPNNLVKVMFPLSNVLHATVLQMTPSVFRLFGLPNIQNYILHSHSSLRILVLGGEPFPSAVELKNWLRPYKKTNRTRIFNIFGITEISCWSTIKEIKNINEEVSLGSALDHTIIIKVVDDNGKDICGEGMGELCIGSSYRKCFIDNEPIRPATSEIVFRSTGDLVYRKDDGTLLYRGRTNEVYKRYGHRINLEYISSKIQELRAFSNHSFLFYDNRLLLFIAMTGNFIQKSQIRKIVQRKLENHEKPDQICFIRNFPTTHHGKISKKKLIQIYRKNMRKKTNSRETFINFLKNALGLNVSSDRSFLDISFIDAGGTSLQAVRLCMEMEKFSGKHQRNLTGILLDSSIPIKSIIKYIEKCDRYSNIKHDSSRSLKLEKNLKLLWKLDMGKCVDASPSFQNEYICVGSHSCLLLTLCANSGQVVSSIRLPDRIESQVQFLDQKLAVVGCYDGFIYVFDYINGKIEWQIDCGGMIKTKSLIFGTNIIVGDYSDVNLKCISIEQKSVKWGLRVGTKGITSSPILLDEKSCLACSLDGVLMKVCLQNGSSIWENKLSSPIFSTPIVLNEYHIAVAEVCGTVNVINVDIGSTVFAYQTDGNIFSNLLAIFINQESALIIFGCHDHKVYCLRYLQAAEEILSLVWSVQQGSAVFSTPNIIRTIQEKAYVVMCSSKGVITICDLDDGTLISSFDVQAEIFSSPCIYNTKVIVGCRDNNIYCFDFVIQ